MSHPYRDQMEQKKLADRVKQSLKESFEFHKNGANREYLKKAPCYAKLIMIYYVEDRLWKESRKLKRRGKIVISEAAEYVFKRGVPADGLDNGILNPLVRSTIAMELAVLLRAEGFSAGWRDEGPTVEWSLKYDGANEWEREFNLYGNYD